jgi:hypothetical protein
MKLLLCIIVITITTNLVICYSHLKNINKVPHIINSTYKDTNKNNIKYSSPKFNDILNNNINNYYDESSYSNIYNINNNYLFIGDSTDRYLIFYLCFKLCNYVIHWTYYNSSYMPVKLTNYSETLINEEHYSNYGCICNKTNNHFIANLFHFGVADSDYFHTYTRYKDRELIGNNTKLRLQNGIQLFNDVLIGINITNIISKSITYTFQSVIWDNSRIKELHLISKKNLNREIRKETIHNHTLIKSYYSNFTNVISFVKRNILKINNRNDICFILRSQHYYYQDMNSFDNKIVNILNNEIKSIAFANDILFYDWFSIEELYKTILKNNNKSNLMLDKLHESFYMAFIQFSNINGIVLNYCSHLLNQ